MQTRVYTDFPRMGTSRIVRLTFERSQEDLKRLGALAEVGLPVTFYDSDLEIEGTLDKIFGEWVGVVDPWTVKHLT